LLDRLGVLERFHPVAYDWVLILSIRVRIAT
jgi:hypothetical protein